MPYDNSYDAPGGLPWWAGYNQQAQQPPTRMFMGIPAWMAQPRPQQQQDDPNQQQNPNPYGQPQQQPTDPLTAWMRRLNPTPHQLKGRSPSQYAQQYGMSLLNPQFPKQGGGQGGQMPYGLAPLYWAPTQNL